MGGDPRRATMDQRETLLARLRRTIAAERQLLAHPLFGVGAARVMVRSRAEIGRIQRAPHHPWR